MEPMAAEAPDVSAGESWPTPIQHLTDRMSAAAIVYLAANANSFDESTAKKKKLFPRK
jgi:hypothetical protein